MCVGEVWKRRVLTGPPHSTRAHLVLAQVGDAEGEAIEAILTLVHAQHLAAHTPQHKGNSKIGASAAAAHGDTPLHRRGVYSAPPHCLPLPHKPSHLNRMVDARREGALNRAYTTPSSEACSRQVQMTCAQGKQVGGPRA